MQTIRTSSGDSTIYAEKTLHHVACGPVVRADDRVRFQHFHYPPNLTCIISVESLHQRGLEGKTSDEKSLAIASDSRFDGRRRIGMSEEGDALATELQKVLRDHVSRPSVVDRNKVIVAALWIRQKTTVD